MGVMVTLPSSIVNRIREEARRQGLSIEEYIIELVSQGLDPRERAAEYIEAAEELVREAREELERGDARQAAEKLWEAVALAIKAYAYWRDGRRLVSHGDLWEYKRVLVRELGRWVAGVWYAGQGMHTCFYEGWCTREDVEEVLGDIERLVKEISSRLRAGET